MTAYAIRGGEEGTRRLDLLSRVVGPTTESFLDAAGIRRGMICLDAGCGAGHVTRSLGRRVGPGGRAVGIERDPVKLAAAVAETERAGLGNVEYREGDVTPGRSLTRTMRCTGDSSSLTWGTGGGSSSGSAGRCAPAAP